MLKKLLALSVLGLFMVGFLGGVIHSGNQSVYAEGSAQVQNQAKEENDQEKEVDVTGVATKLTIEEALQLVKNQYPGAKIIGIEKEDENGTVVYGVHFSDKNGSYDLKLDANTGKILKKDANNNDSEDKDKEEHEHENDQEGDHDQGHDEEGSVED